MKRRSYITIIILCLSPLHVSAQSQLSVNIMMLDGVELTPDNILNYQITNSASTTKEVVVKGSLIYRNTGLTLNYTYKAFLTPGVNFFSSDRVPGISWSFSDNALRELFFNYKKLPQGTYEYCVDVSVVNVAVENILPDPYNSCLYYKVEDIFLINLVDPENDAKIYEYYPSFSWVVNYPFASELKYRFRLTDVKQGQTNEVAIVRNPLIYENKSVFATTTVYPVTAKPLEKFQPYAWTVDAYYKGILLGGAEVWRFTIIEDTLLQPVPADPAYVELNIERGNSVVYAPGILKLKHIENERLVDTLTMTLYDEKQKIIRLPDAKWVNSKGDNRKIIQFHNVLNLKHMADYRLVVSTETGHTYTVSFKYFNPIFLKQ